jgi:hypothetical protein
MIRSSIFGTTGTPRVKRWGSRISRRAAKEFECPLWGEPRLDRLAQPDVIGDEEVDSRQRESLREGRELIALGHDPGAQRRLEELRIGRRDAAPAKGEQIRGEGTGVVGTRVPRDGASPCGDDTRVDLRFPHDIQALALCVIVDAGQRGAHARKVRGSRAGHRR